MRGPRYFVRAALALLAFTLLGLALAQGASAANRIAVVPGANGSVRAISEPDTDGTRYIGGDFTAFDQWNTGHGTMVGATSGRVNPSFPAVSGGSGIVYAAVPDGSGGVYIGGSFTTVGDVPRANAAHINADGTVDADWNPAPNGTVRAIARSGSTVYLGGIFSLVGAQSRANLAAVGTNGTVSAWSPGTNGAVYAIAVSGSIAYVGGGFTTVDGVTSNRLAAIDTVSGALASFSADAGTSIVYAITVSGSTVYVGGTFSTMNSVTRNRAAAVGAVGSLAGGGTLLAWDPNTNGTVQALAVHDSTVYLGGAFTTVGGVTRNRAAAVGAVGSLAGAGTLLGWNPSATGTGLGVMSLQVSGATVYLGGSFTAVGTETRSRMAAVDTNGTLLPWNPNANGIVHALAATGTSIYAGGAFTAAGGLQRNRVAAVSSAGAITSWNPGADASVTAVVLSGSTVFLGGSFTSVAGASRGRGAAVGTDGTLGSWDPLVVGNDIRAIAVSGSVVYLAGDFTSVRGTPRARAAALGLDGTTLHGWDPAPGGIVTALAVSGSTVYLGGSFTSVGGTGRNNAAAVGAVGSGAGDGVLLGWNPDANGQVLSIAVSGSTVYLGGTFTTMNGGATRNRAAAVGTSGTVTAWNPSASGTVRSIAVSGSSVYLAGDFTALGVTARGFLAEVGADGQPTSWNPVVGGSVLAIKTGTSFMGNAVVYAGGPFTTVGGTAWTRAAMLSAATGSLATPRWPHWGPPPTGVVATTPPTGAANTAVSFVPPDDDGAWAISHYDVRCESSTAPSATGVGTQSPVTVGPLTPGATYTCTVVGITNTERSLTSSPSSPIVVPAAAPEPPSAGSATSPAVDRATSISFSIGQDNGSAITGHDVTCTSATGATRTAAGATSPIIVSSLTKGATYNCTVTATNGVGASPPSSAMTVVVPATAPDAPGGVSAILDGGRVVVSWSAPDTGGAAITGYTVTATPGGAQCAAAVTSCAFSGLPAGASYAFTVTATNGVGESAASPSSGAVSIPVPPVATPAAMPAAPVPASPVAVMSTPAGPAGPGLRVGVPTSARTAATWAGLKVPKGARVVLSVPRGEARRCAIKRGAVVAATAGTCTVTVTVRPRKGKPIRRTLAVPAS